MKNQLLEDIDDSQSGPSLPLVRHAQPAAAPVRLAPVALPDAHAHPEAWSRRGTGWRLEKMADAAPPPATAPEPDRRAGVWQSRPASAPADAGFEYAVPPAPPTLPDPPAESASFASGEFDQGAFFTSGEPDQSPYFTSREPDPSASFASRAPDWAIPLRADPLPWTERWGRKALGWGAAVAAVVVVAGAATWMVRESQVQTTLAMVADAAPAPAIAAQPEATIPPEPEPLPLPPLRLLPREPLAAAVDASAPPEDDVALAEDAPLAVNVRGDELPDADPVAAVPAPAPPRRAVPVRAARKPVPDTVIAKSSVGKAAAAAPAPKVKRPPERRVVAAAPVKRGPAAEKKPRASRPPERVAARVPAWPVPKMAPADRAPQPARAAPPQVPDSSPPQPAAANPLAETLRMCRAAGYHATACIKRGCEATRFGLACRG